MVRFYHYSTLSDFVTVKYVHEIQTWALFGAVGLGQIGKNGKIGFSLFTSNKKPRALSMKQPN